MAKRKPLKLPCSFGSVTIGDQKASIGVSIDRANLSIEDAEANFCGRRMSGVITAKAVREAKGQQHLGYETENGKETDEPATYELSADFDTKSFRVSPKLIAAGLTLNLPDCDVSNLAHFAKLEGTLTIHNVGAIPAGEDGDDD